MKLSMQCHMVFKPLTLVNISLNICRECQVDYEAVPLGTLPPTAIGEQFLKAGARHVPNLAPPSRG